MNLFLNMAMSPDLKVRLRQHKPVGQNTIEFHGPARNLEAPKPCAAGDLFNGLDEQRISFVDSRPNYSAVFVDDY
jgi:hypothetical protein